MIDEGKVGRKKNDAQNYKNIRRLKNNRGNEQRIKTSNNLIKMNKNREK